MSGCGKDRGNPTTATFVVTGMSCAHCKAAVEKGVRGVPGVKSVEVDLETGLLRVSYDPDKTTLAEIQKAVVDAGYGVAEKR